MEPGIVEQEPLMTHSGDEDGCNEARVRGAMEVEMEASSRDRESDLPYPRHALPAHPRVADYVLFYPRSVQVYFSRLCARFGWRYVAIIMIVYGCQQGWGQSWSGIATYWYLLSPPPGGLGWNNTTFSLVLMLANIPWQIKALYGMVSDTFPIGGRSRSPYIAAAAAVGLVAYLTLSVGVVDSRLGLGAVLLATNLAQASPDVMIDASIAESSKRHPLYAADLQSLCWGSYFLAHCLAAEVGGLLQKFFGSRLLYASVSITCLLVFWPALRGWLKDVAPTAVAGQPKGMAKLISSFSHPVQRPVFCLALFTTVCAIAQGFVGNSVADKHAWWVGGVTLVLMSFGIWHWQRQISPVLAKATLYIYLSGALQPSTSVLSVWLKETNDPDDANCGSADAAAGSQELMWYESKWCHQCAAGRSYLEGDGIARPCFDAPFLALLSVVGSFFGLLGTAVYNGYFAQLSYRRIFAYTQAIAIVLSFADLLWVTRANVRYGVSDKVFVLGQELIGPIVSRLATMPVFVLAAQLCPDNVEATLFALMMGISNMSASTGNLFGVGLVAAMRTYEPVFPHLQTFINVRNLCSLLPLPLIPLLCPVGTPSSTMADMQRAEDRGKASAASAATAAAAVFTNPLSNSDVDADGCDL